MFRNLYMFFLTGSLVLAAGFILSGCNLPVSSVNPSAVPTLTAAPSPLPTRTATITAPDTPLKSVADVSLRAFQMVDARNGWAASDTMVLRSVHGGTAWQDVTPKDFPAGAGPVFQVTAISPDTAWVLAPDPNDPKNGRLFRTANGGETWQASAVPFGGGNIQLIEDRQYAVLMADRGVAAGSQAVDLYLTGDGGASWRLISHIDPENPSDQGIPFGGIKSGAAFRDAAHGWVAGFIPMEGAIYLYATEDGGETWRQVPLDLPAGWEQAQIETKPPVFFGGEAGILTLRASANGGQLVFYATSNGGGTWQAGIPLKAGGLVSIPGSSDIIVWDGGILHYSLDGGQTWQERTPNIDLSQGLVALQFVDRDTGWALSQDGDRTRLYATIDGGLTWQ